MGRMMFVLSAVALLSACSMVPPSTQLTQEKQACAEAGIAPGETGYGTCVTNLDAALIQAQQVTN